MPADSTTATHRALVDAFGGLEGELALGKEAMLGNYGFEIIKQAVVFAIEWRTRLIEWRLFEWEPFVSTARTV